MNARLVALVVAVTPVADEVDQEVETEADAIFPRQPRRLEAGDRIVGVDVDDRNLEAARQAARVAGAVGLAGRGREPELVVGDDVNRAAGVVAGQPRQVQRLGDDALAGERRVAVNEDRQRQRGRRTAPRPADRPIVPAARAMPTTTGSTASRWLGFGAIVTYIWPRGAAVRAPAWYFTSPIQPRSVRNDLRRDRILELREDLRVRLVEHVREHVQPAAMRHAEHRVARAVVGRRRR